MQTQRRHERLISCNPFSAELSYRECCSLLAHSTISSRGAASHELSVVPRSNQSFLASNDCLTLNCVALRTLMATVALGVYSPKCRSPVARSRIEVQRPVGDIAVAAVDRVVDHTKGPLSAGRHVKEPTYQEPIYRLERSTEWTEVPSYEALTNSKTKLLSRYKLRSTCIYMQNSGRFLRAGTTF